MQNCAYNKGAIRSHEINKFQNYVMNFGQLFFKIHKCSVGESLEDALRQLYLIDAIDENGQITDVGRVMAGILSPSHLY